MSYSVFITNCPFQATEQEVRGLFDRAVGGVAHLKLLSSLDGPGHRGCGFVAFETLDYQAVALAEDGKIQLYGRAIFVKPVRPKPDGDRAKRQRETGRVSRDHPVGMETHQRS